MLYKQGLGLHSNYSPSTWTDKYITKKASVRRKNNADTLFFGAAILLQNVLTQRGCRAPRVARLQSQLCTPVENCMWR